jgi:ATP-dependent DNA helicase PIF1
MELSKEQQIAYDKYIAGHNIFITGPGGSGKSELIRIIYRHAYQHFKEMHVTALTGCAAILLNCKAKTLHSWAGIGLGNGTSEDLIQKIKKKSFIKDVWKNTDILVVDEISMLSLKLFNTLNDIGKAIRRNNRPFGGIQLIFSGDFYQLPPVGDYLEPDTQKFCFESAEWNNIFPLHCQIELRKIFRQTDEIYATILNQIREGQIKRRSNDLLMNYVNREIDPLLIIEPTKLYPTKKQVEQINVRKMCELTSEEELYKIQYLTDCEMTKGEKEIRRQYTDRDIQLELDFIASNLICEKEYKIKIGAQVMCIINIKNVDGDVFICNGSQGIVEGFSSTIIKYPIVRFNNGTVRVMTPHVWISEKIPGIGVSQVPLILAWALTIHKSQGATLDAAEVDVGSGIFECGQTYVALSRVKSLNGLYLTSFDASRIRINKRAKEYYTSLRSYTSREKALEDVPLVIAEEIQHAVPVHGSSSFIQYAYPEAHVIISPTPNKELVEEQETEEQETEE